MVVRQPDVVAAAVEILDAYGLADLTMRRVAERLNVKAGALYWHIPNKQTLLARVADAILDQVPPPSDADWRGWLRSWASGLRATLLRHRDAAELVSSSLASELCTADIVTPASDRLTAAGLSPADARAAARALVHLTLGHVSEEQNRATLVELGALKPPADDTEADHAVGIELLLDGVTSRLAG
ncbi:TetR/AcrR family transcriptional regulator C-terminal domain-containing protein [Nigerium sp.]|uniref:TetR family transcriptional regulator n=1 Tax=Nigerium sp. TaxID=2042655 RepID=UPI00322162D9